MDRIGDSSLAPSLFPPSWGSVERGAEKEAVPQGTWHMTGTWGLAIVQLSSTCQRWGFAFSWMKRVAEKGLWLLQMGPPMQSSINRCHSDVSPRQMMSLRPQWESRMFTPFSTWWFCDFVWKCVCHAIVWESLARPLEIYCVGPESFTIRLLVSQTVGFIDNFVFFDFLLVSTSLLFSPQSYLAFLLAGCWSPDWSLRSDMSCVGRLDGTSVLLTVFGSNMRKIWRFHFAFACSWSFLQRLGTADQDEISVIIQTWTTISLGACLSRRTTWRIHNVFTTAQHDWPLNTFGHKSNALQCNKLTIKY